MTAMEEAVLDELSHYKECLEKLEAYSKQQPEEQNNWLRGYYMGKISAYECALELFEVQKKCFERRGFAVDS